MKMVDYYDPQLERLSRASLDELQRQRLSLLVKELATNGFYQHKFRSAGIEPGEITSKGALAQLPFTTKSELVAEQATHPPFGRLLTYPLSSYRYFHQTSGTTGRPLKWLDTAESWEWWARCWGYVYRASGVTDDDIVFCAFSFGPYISHWAAISGAWQIGAMCIPGGGMNSDQRLQTILDNRCTVLACTPTYALHLAEAARARGIDLSASAIRIGIHAGEPGASLPNIKRAIEQAWGATCFDHAGATEVGAWAFGCRAQTGAIHLNEAEFIFEVVSPSTGLSVSEGERGELVITTLGRAAMPVLRYRTGDLVELVSKPCECGRTFARIKGGVLGRADDMLIVRGVNIYPSAIDDLLRGVPGIVEYEVNIRRVEELDDLLVKLEVAPGCRFDAVKLEALDQFRRLFNIRVSIEEATYLPRYEFKARRFKRA